MSILSGFAKLGKGALHYGDDAAKALTRYGDDVAKASSKVASAGAKASVLSGAGTAAKIGLIGGSIGVAGLGLQAAAKPFQELLYGYQPPEPVKASDSMYLYPSYDSTGNVSYTPMVTPEAQVAMAKALPDTASSSNYNDLLLLSMLGRSGVQSQTQQTTGGTNWESILKLGLIGVGVMVVAPPLLQAITKKK